MHPQVQSMRALARTAPALAEVLARRSARAGRASHLGLDCLTSLVFADLRDKVRHVCPDGHVHVTVWVTHDPTGALPATEDLVREATPDGVVVTLELRTAGRWARARGWWAETVDRILRYRART